MTLDDRLTNAARHVADGLVPPVLDLDSIRAQARRNSRRSAAVTVAVTLSALVTVGASLAGGSDSDRSIDPVLTPTPTVTSTPTPTPTPTDADDGRRGPTTGEEVVFEPGAAVQTVGVLPSDPDVRLSVWTFYCRRCPEPGGPSSTGTWPSRSYTAVALTTDGFETANYILNPFESGTDLHVTSPRDDLFLIVDANNHRQWLVDLAGTVRELTRVRTELRPSDPRLWFTCHTTWRNKWCSLDPDQGTYYVWPKKWEGSAVSPLDADEPWGTHPEQRAAGMTGQLEAWWESRGIRAGHVVTQADTGDYVLDSPPGEMAFWAPGGVGIEIHSSRDGGATWQVDSREAGIRQPYVMRRAADGAFLAFAPYPRFEVWRAAADGGPFQKVFEAPSTKETTGAGLWSQDGILYATAMGTVAVSVDDGLSWKRVDTWRGAE